MTTQKEDDPQQDDSLESTRMSLGEHLDELRSRLVKSAAVFAIAFVIAWFSRVELAEIIRGPFDQVAERIDNHRDELYSARVEEEPELWRKYFTSPDEDVRRLLHPTETRLLVTDVGEQFVFALNVSIGFALFIGSPFFLWQMWQFIAAGLYKRERRGVRKAFPFSVALFLGGVVFAFFLIVPTGMYFLQVTLDPDQVETNLRVQSYFRFVRTLSLSMGVVFQLPILMVFASRFGLIRPATFGRYRGHWVVGALIIAALLTPGPDFYSQLLMAIPMVVLYEIGIQIGRFVSRPRDEEQVA
jgi:Tat protein translocase TatC